MIDTPPASISSFLHQSPLYLQHIARLDDMSKTTFYRHLQKHLNIRVHCPGCMEEMTLDKFYNDHALKRHGLNKFRRCVFCFGKRGLTKGLRQENVAHKIECLKKFVDDTRIRTNDIEKIPCDTIPLCEDMCRKFRHYPRDMRGRVKDRLSEFVGFYDSIFEKPEMWRVPKGVKLNARCGFGNGVYAIVQRYLKEDLT
ncbi:hypothetical protein AVEN_13887-1 [Araneus ventricosus]|uniref:Uncharacterized protein n=1 Tax=Araneus ventricosus TaxID=182803 RepID=A0A4Y2M6Y0_ARAVE|nr:hypothetical protein AVEN_13887-1 [Araneus ventricosus]